MVASVRGSQRPSPPCSELQLELVVAPQSDEIAAEVVAELLYLGLEATAQLAQQLLVRRGWPHVEHAPPQPARRSRRDGGQRARERIRILGSVPGHAQPARERMQRGEARSRARLHRLRGLDRNGVVDLEEALHG